MSVHQSPFTSDSDGEKWKESTVPLRVTRRELCAKRILSYMSVHQSPFTSDSDREEWKESTVPLRVTRREL
ncbi:MAG: hypothetical protein H6553_01910 [Chitinophagales bacterium]|nr:hypothetical protein [Chitinophagales bacterium]